MDKLKCVIIEDELPAAEEIKYIIDQYDFMFVEGLAYDGVSGMELIKIKKPHVVFMDINIPLKNGMELAKNVKEFDETIDIVFVTAYEDHALEAFQVDALDYILKPFDENRIDITLRRLFNKRKPGNNYDGELPKIMNQIINKMDREEKLVKKIPCDRNGKIILIDIKDIYYCYIQDEKTYVKTKNDKYLVGYTLHQIEEKTDFFRAHRSYLVNMDNIKELYSWFNGTYKLVMHDLQKSEIPISRNNVKKLKELLGI